jgi:hypothetical protein
MLTGTQYLFEMRTRIRLLINAGCNTVKLTAMGAILSAWAGVTAQLATEGLMCRDHSNHQRFTGRSALGIVKTSWRCDSSRSTSFVRCSANSDVTESKSERGTTDGTQGLGRIRRR